MTVAWLRLRKLEDINNIRSVSYFPISLGICNIVSFCWLYSTLSITAYEIKAAFLVWRYIPVGPKRCACPINGHDPCMDGMSLNVFIEEKYFLAQREIPEHTKRLVLAARWFRSIAIPSVDWISIFKHLIKLSINQHTRYSECHTYKLYVWREARLFLSSKFLSVRSNVITETLSSWTFR